ncbi:PP2C family protein-serine/threonine phosphatase [Planctomycetota bacterium]
MSKAEAVTAVESLNTFTDVLYVTDRGRMPSQIKRLLKQGKLSSLLLPVGEFLQVSNHLDLIGTVIIDDENLDFSQKSDLPRTIELLETSGIGTILLGKHVDLPVKSFSLGHSSVKSFSLATKMKALSIDDLWIRISLNLAYRNEHSKGLTKAAAPSPNSPPAGKGDLTEQLGMTETLVDNIAEQLRLAGLVQRDFLPTELPDCDKVQWGKIFLPAEWVSGDIYDAVRIDENHIGFYIADVVGHGIPAALLTIFVKQTLVMRQTLKSSYHIFSPAKVMENLNVRMTSQKFSGYQFATCCCCLLNTETLELTYCRGGHPYPVLLRGDSEPKQLQIKGSLLGIFPDAQYVQETVQLQPGDKLLLYSDGAEPLIGAFDDQDGFVFKDEFCEIRDLPIVEMTNRLNILAQNHRVDPAELDDITIVGFELL